jgi:glycosyl-4,4'-diaponeurosporenoate acyltransferase
MQEKRRTEGAFDIGALIMALLFVLSVAVFALTSGDRLKHLFKPLYVFLRMASIVGIIGIAAFFIGESIPRSLYDYRRFPFKCYKWERNGEIYVKLGVRWLKSHSIDMSSIMPKAFPKQNTMSRDKAHLERLVQEMCNAELVHWILMFLSPVFWLLIEGWYGVAIAIGYALSNLGDIMIQRYNRPRIVMIIKRMEACESC